VSWAQREAAKIAREDIINAAERADFEQREAAARELRRENHRRAQAASNIAYLRGRS